MSNGFGEGSQVEVGIVFVLDVIMGHVGMAKAVNSYIMSQTDFLQIFRCPWLVLQLTPLPKGKLEEPQMYLCSRRMALYFSLMLRFADFCSGPAMQVSGGHLLVPGSTGTTP